MPIFRLIPIVALFALFSACDESSPHNHAADAAVDAEVLPPLPSIEGLTELEDLNADPRVVEVELTAKTNTVQILSGAPTPMLNYNDLFPGPLLHARVGDRVIVHFYNDLDEATTIHWHGLRISDDMDGSPRIQTPVEPGESFTYDFVVPDAGTFWYHTHLHTIAQFERGLYGALVVHEAEPPVFSAERMFMIDDIRLNASHRVAAFETSGPDIGRGRIGNTLLLNGTPEPARLTIAHGAVERWRVVLATNALSIGLRIRGAHARVISTDGGLLPEPFDLDRVEMAPGQRYDLEVRALEDATEVALEAMIFVVNENDEVVEEPYALITADVDGEIVIADPIYPAVTHPSTDVEAEELTWLMSGGVVDGHVVFTINGMSTYAGDAHDHPLLHTFETGVPVRMKLRSEVSPEHPFHLHGQFFQIIERDGMPVTNEPGLRDTVQIRGAQSVTILSYFDNPGRWMVHCHISEHSENGMMGEVQVGEEDAHAMH